MICSLLSSYQEILSIFDIFLQFNSIFCSSCSILGVISLLIFQFLLSIDVYKSFICYRSSFIYDDNLCESIKDCLQISYALINLLLEGTILVHQITSSLLAQLMQSFEGQYYYYFIKYIPYFITSLTEDEQKIFILEFSMKQILITFIWHLFFLTQIYKKIIYTINGMINTFASIKGNKENFNHTYKNMPIKRQENQPTSFKEIKELKQSNINRNITINSGKKILQNQQNTFCNALPNHSHENTIRKNLIKVDKSKKKVNYSHVYRSPNHKLLQLQPETIKDKAQRPSNHKLKLNLQRNEENYFVYAPTINKYSSFTRDANDANQDYLTVKQVYTQLSEQGSVNTSQRASFDDSFNLYPTNVSYEQEDRGLRLKTQNVNTSMELSTDNLYASSMSHRIANQCKRLQNDIQNMKKTSYYYCSNLAKEDDRCLRTQEDASVSSSISSNINTNRSINFTEKFKHYKRQHQQKNELKQFPAKLNRPLTLADFDKVEEIGSGKYSKVYQVRHIQTGFVCALKSVSKKIIREQNLQIPFIREVKIQMHLNHPNVVKLYGFFHDAENIYLIMEYCSGSHLFKMIKQRKRLQEEEIVSILSNVFQAVSFLHCNGVIHRDLKPENIVIENGVYKICDFGWAAYACGDSRTTFCGTPMYVCPQILKEQQYNTKADIWGLGIITYELTFGRVPFPILKQTDLMKIINDPVYFPIWGRTSQKLIPFIKGMLSKNPDDRPSLNQILSCEVFRSFTQKINVSLKVELERIL